MKKKLLAFITSLAVGATMLLSGSAVAFADDETETVTVDMTVQQDGGFVVTHEQLEVDAGISDRYDAYAYVSENFEKTGAAGSDHVSMLDVLIAAHEKYVSGFNKDTAADYFVIAESGGTEKIWGWSTNMVDYYVNGSSAVSFGTRIEDGDSITLYKMQDTSRYTDVYTQFTTDEMEMSTGTSSDVTLQHPYYDEMKSFNGAQIYYMDANKSSMTAMDGAVTDGNGKASVKFDTAGTYYLTAKSSDTPIVMPWCKVTVKDPTFGSAQLSYTSATYSGSSKEPSVTVKNNTGAAMTEGTDYDVTYSNNKNVGKASVCITGKGTYDFSKTLTFKINPKGTTIRSLKRYRHHKFKIKWKKQSAETSGYQIRYSKKSSMSSAKTVTVSGSSKTYRLVKGVAKGRKYVQIRTYKTVNGTKYTSAWSSAKKVRVR